MATLIGSFSYEHIIASKIAAFRLFKLKLCQTGFRLQAPQGFLFFFNLLICTAKNSLAFSQQNSTFFHESYSFNMFVSHRHLKAFE